MVSKIFRQFLLLLLTTSLVVTPVAQASVTAGSIFGSMAGTVSIDQAGVMTSQARTMVSLGGGMATVRGKQVNLMAVDPFSFSAGCSGISWHFGGFSFISADEIRQMVEAVSQAALGVVIDLAMHTLCPTCYAVMSKMREMANAMRNQSYNACQVAKALGSKLAGALELNTDVGSTKSVCSTTATEENKAPSSLGAQIGNSDCSTFNSVNNFIGGKYAEISKWFDDMLKPKIEGGAQAGKAPTQDIAQLRGNVTYKKLIALGYSEGFAMDVMLSMVGMVVYTPGETCTDALKGIEGLKSTINPLYPDVKTTSGEANAVIKKTDGTAPTGEDVKNQTNEPQAPATGSTKGPVTCFAPPTLTDSAEIGKLLMCGYNPLGDLAVFARRFSGLYGGDVDALKQKITNSTGFGAMCQLQDLTKGKVANTTYSGVKGDVVLYTCAGSGDCVHPKTRTFAELSQMNNELLENYANENKIDNSKPDYSPIGLYTGVAWMVLDSLYRGVAAVRTGGNDVPKNESKDAGMSSIRLPVDTLQILASSEYPLYRIMNLAAVYPGVADNILIAYATAIAAQHTSTALRQVITVGAQTTVAFKDTPGVTQDSLIALRGQINTLTGTLGNLDKEALSSLAQKQALIDLIKQTNRAIQAEAVQFGLSGNSRMGISISRAARAKK